MLSRTDIVRLCAGLALGVVLGIIIHQTFSLTTGGDQAGNGVRLAANLLVGPGCNRAALGRPEVGCMDPNQVCCVQDPAGINGTCTALSNCQLYCCIPSAGGGPGTCITKP